MKPLFFAIWQSVARGDRVRTGPRCIPPLPKRACAATLYCVRVKSLSRRRACTPPATCSHGGHSNARAFGGERGQVVMWSARRRTGASLRTLQKLLLEWPSLSDLGERPIQRRAACRAPPPSCNPVDGEPFAARWTAPGRAGRGSRIDAHPVAPSPLMRLTRLAPKWLA